MAKLTGKKKAEFLARMAKGRKKAARGNPKRKAKKRATTKSAKNKPGKLTGKKKAEFLKRMARGRRKAAASNPRKKTAKKNAKPAHRKLSNSTLKRGAAKARKANASRRRGRNPDGLQGALSKYEEFHGRPAGHVLTGEQREHYREFFADMGKLKELRVYLDKANPDFPIRSFGEALAVCTPEGTNIYFIGGDQSLNLEAFGITSDKDFVELGPCTFIMYDTQKGFHNFAQVNYYHHFGEEDGIYPVLAYDRLNKSLFLVGGNYQVRPEGIVN